MSVANQDLQLFSRFSKWAGERWDWVQAGGGNSGLKSDQGHLLVKASGVSLTEVEEGRGHCVVELGPIQEIVRQILKQPNLNKADREQTAKSELEKYILPNQEGRPSIETFLHAFLFKYTLHLHPVCVVSALSTPQAPDYARAFWEDANVPGVFLDYATPGIDLALLLLRSIDKHLEKSDEIPKVVFMKNHGVLISSNSIRELREITENCSRFFEKLAGLDYTAYWVGHKVSAIVNSQSVIPQVALWGDCPLYTKAFENKFFFTELRPLTPDDFVFWGRGVCLLEQLSERPMSEFKSRYGHWPKVIIFERKIYFLGSTLRKCREIEEVFRARLTIAFSSSLNHQIPLPEEELHYLANWEAEKYRQKI